MTMTLAVVACERERPHPKVPSNRTGNTSKNFHDRNITRIERWVKPIEVRTFLPSRLVLARRTAPVRWGPCPRCRDSLRRLCDLKTAHPEPTPGPRNGRRSRLWCCPRTLELWFFPPPHPRTCGNLSHSR